MEKPQVLTTLQYVLPQAFEVLSRNYGVAGGYYLDLASIDSVTADQLSRHLDIAAIAMRKLQGLNVHTAQGVETPNDLVIGLCAELNRAVAQLVLTTPSLSLDDRRALVAALRAIQQCGEVVGTMAPLGELVIFE